MRALGGKWLCALLIALVAASSAVAAPIDGSSQGTFVNPTGPSGMVTSGVGTSSFTWGIPSGTTNPSSLDFTGLTFSSATETPFKVGTLAYYNGTIAAGSGADTVDLKVNLSFTTPPGVVQDFAYTLQLINTPNTQDPVESADYVKLPTTFTPRVFSYGGVDYTLQLLGFDNPSQGGFVQLDQFFVLEDSRASADLIAKVTSDIPPVPEPASLTLAGLGLAAVLRSRMRRN